MEIYSIEYFIPCPNVAAAEFDTSIERFLCALSPLTASPTQLSLIVVERRAWVLYCHIQRRRRKAAAAR